MLPTNGEQKTRQNALKLGTKRKRQNVKTSGADEYIGTAVAQSDSNCLAGNVFVGVFVIGRFLDRADKLAKKKTFLSLSEEADERGKAQPPDGASKKNVGRKHYDSNFRVTFSSCL